MQQSLENGGPGWLNLLALLCAWNTIKLTLNGPITLVLLCGALIRESKARRQAISV